MIVQHTHPTTTKLVGLSRQRLWCPTLDDHCSWLTNTLIEKKDTFSFGQDLLAFNCLAYWFTIFPYDYFSFLFLSFYLSAFFVFSLFTCNFLWFIKLRALDGMCEVCACVCVCVLVCSGVCGTNFQNTY